MEKRILMETRFMENGANVIHGIASKSHIMAHIGWVQSLSAWLIVYGS